MRILLAGTGSGCGKTTVSLLLMTALKARGLDVAPYKVGPDYIDPGFHGAICGRPSYNLDSWLMTADEMRRVLNHTYDIAVVEGVMGYYDGLDSRSFRCSTWEIAQETKTPVILIADASGGAASVAATVKGFQTLVKDSGIAGVLINRVSGDRHYSLVREAVERYTGLPCVGYLTKKQALRFPSRHLGLVPAEETDDLLPRIQEAAAEAAGTLDIEAILRIASRAVTLPEAKPLPLNKRTGYRLGVALDEAFHFYYQANLDALQSAGVELVFFSPLRDERLPDRLSGLYLGGGFPEVFAKGLSQNLSMRTSVKNALENGLPCYAECGGLMYLGKDIDGIPMADYLPLRCCMTDRLQHFGYITVTDRTGLSFPAHEFHHAQAEPLPDASLAYQIQKASAPDKAWACGWEKKQTLAAFAHVYFADRPDLMRRFFP